MALQNPSLPASPGNPTAIEVENALKNPNMASLTTPTAPAYTSGFAIPEVSSTTISNANKQAQVPGIINTTEKFADTGIKTDANGNQIYANGQLVPATEVKQPTPTANLATPGVSQGGYVGEVYYAPGSPLPIGQDGKPLQTTETAPTDDKIMANLSNLQAQSDAITASMVESIKAQYAQLRQAQERSNQQQEASVERALLMGGVTGKGGSARYAPISSAGIVQAQVNYGIGLIAELTAKENSAILQAKQAQLDNNFRLMESLNTQIGKVREEKVKATEELNKKLLEQSEKLREQQLTADKDTAVAEIYESGITDPKQILATLKSQGITMTAKELQETITAITPSIEERNYQRAAIEYAIDNGITKDFYLVGRQAIDTQTGLPVSLQEYQKRTGQRVGASEEETDFSFIQPIALPQVKTLQNKYYDAGILDTDTVQEAVAKLPNSSIWQSESVEGLETQVVDLGNGQKALIDTQTGDIIQQYGSDTSEQSGYTSEQNQRIITSVDELLPQVNGFTTGPGGLAASKIPGTPAYNLKSELDTLKAAIAFGALNAMREASKTGGALGSIAVAELQLLESTLGSLNQGQSPANFKEQLTKIKESVERWNGAVQKESGSPSGTTKMKGPDGVDYFIPNDKVEEAKKDGMTVISFNSAGKPQASTSYIKAVGTVSAVGSPLWDKGLDIAGKKGTPIPSPISGTVIAVGNNGGFGRQVKILGTDGREYWISHLDNFNVKTGQKITKGVSVGGMGNSGNVLKLDGSKPTPKELAAGRGTHADITVKEKGKYLSAADVKKLLEQVMV